MQKVCLIFLLMLSLNTFACSCESIPLDERFREASLVVTVRLLERSGNRGSFELIEQYKGTSKLGPKISLSMGANNSCDVPHSSAVNYLVFIADTTNPGMVACNSMPLERYRLDSPSVESGPSESEVENILEVLRILKMKNDMRENAKPKLDY
ncbi:MAG: hypothetical protein HWE13_09440 [Gammaproteobacteria bacterium]|nr:hypothetical protein [Gammaproteobacteria bacterium]NVK88339.1 hypothetical protein [Gammaproteobacteria bacterium]